MTKRALLVGCNYPGTKVELHGCANDVRRMHKTLTSRFGFHERDILVLLDTNKSGAQPTGANIRNYLAKMIGGVEPGDVLVFHYSGHGTQVPAEGGAVDETGVEEAIVPTDMNLLTDDDFRELVDRIPPGATFTFMSDSCHSGGLIDSAKEQIGSSSSSMSAGAHSHGFAGGQGGFGGDGGLMGLVSQGLQAFGNRDMHTRDFHFSHGSTESRFEERVSHYRREGGGEPQQETYERHGGRHNEWGDHGDRRRSGDVEEYSHTLKSREIPVAMLTQILSERTGHKVDIGNIRTTLFDMFGDDASPAVKVFAKIALDQLRKRGRSQTGIMGAVSSLATQFLAAKLEGQSSEQAAHYVAPAEKAGHHRPRPRQGHSERPIDVGILLSGCQPDETSADAQPAQGESYGAFSNAIQTVLSKTDAPLSNRELVMQVRKTLQSQGFKQHPCLYCTDDNADAVFISN